MISRVGRWLAGLEAEADDVFERVQIDVRQVPELDAIARHRRLPEPFAEPLAEEVLVLDADDVERDAAGVGAEADLVEIAGLAVGTADRLRAIADIGIADDLARLVAAIEEPQIAAWRCVQDELVHGLQFLALGLGLIGEILRDLRLRVHIGRSFPLSSRPALPHRFIETTNDAGRNRPGVEIFPGGGCGLNGS